MDRSNSTSSDASSHIDRRRYLALCAAGVGGAIAGCQSGASETTTSPVEDPRETTRQRATTRRSSDSTAETFTELYQQVVDSVTLIDTPTGTGSGWVFDGAGRVLTNQHVVETDATVNVRYERDEWRRADVVGRDGIGDLAVLEPTNPPSYATRLPTSTPVPAVGEDIAIVGAPFALPSSLSVGVVSARNRFLDSPTGSSIPGAIQVDATANPGNSGGPIFSTAGEVVGVLNSGEGVAVNFGIPARLVEMVAPALVDRGRYRYATLGVSILEVDPTIAQANDLDEVTGVLITTVSSGGPAAGRLRGSTRQRYVDGQQVPVGGDVVVGLDGRTITADSDFASYLTYSTRPGDSVDVTALRNGSRQTVTVTLGSRSRP